MVTYINKFFIKSGFSDNFSHFFLYNFLFKFFFTFIYLVYRDRKYLVWTTLFKYKFVITLFVTYLGIN